MAAVPNSTVLHRMIRHILTHKPQKYTVKDKEGVLMHTGPGGLGLVVEAMLREQQDTAHAPTSGTKVMILSGKVVGNVNDNPSHAAHKRKHRWSL